METAERPGVEERYETAGNTSDLTVAADRGGAADVMIAAGWSESRVGMALLRLHSEWDGAAKPRRPTEAIISAMAESMRADAEKERSRWGPPPKDRPIPKMATFLPRARAEAIVWYAKELRLLAQALKSREPVLRLVHPWAAVKGIPSDAVGPALFHWLHHTCAVCDGHGLRKVADQPALSGKRCHRCGGTGKEPRPADAARIQNWLDDCLQKARTSLRARLRATR